MANGRNKFQSREDRARVGKILMREWDPIGIKDVPEASDEYDAYVGRVYVMLVDERATAAQIAAYLDEIASNHMGLGASPEGAAACLKAATALIAMRPPFELH